MGQAVLHQLSVSLLLFQHHSSDQRERVWQTERKLEVGCGPAALRMRFILTELSSRQPGGVRATGYMRVG